MLAGDPELQACSTSRAAELTLDERFLKGSEICHFGGLGGTGGPGYLAKSKG